MTVVLLSILNRTETLVRIGSIAASISKQLMCMWVGTSSNASTAGQNNSGGTSLEDSVVVSPEQDPKEGAHQVTVTLETQLALWSISGRDIEPKTLRRRLHNTCA